MNKQIDVAIATIHLPPTNLLTAGFSTSEPTIETALERAQAEVDRLNEWPEVVDVMHKSEAEFLLEMEHWLKKGYRLGSHSIQSFERGDYYVLLYAPLH